MRSIACLALVAVAVGSARAQIYEWRDAEGIAHYTNVKELIPEPARSAARVVAEALPPPAVAEEAPRPPERAEAVVGTAPAFDAAALEAAYRLGFAEGEERARRSERPAAPEIHVRGPVAVAVGWYGMPGYVPYEPLVTTSFDRGRSRHLTLRLLLQEQFALDREAPYIYWERFFPPHHHPPLGPALHPFLRRGLPHGWPPCGRVIAR
jgi:hypothetical protein